MQYVQQLFSLATMRAIKCTVTLKMRKQGLNRVIVPRCTYLQYVATRSNTIGLKKHGHVVATEDWIMLYIGWVRGQRM